VVTIVGNYVRHAGDCDAARSSDASELQSLRFQQHDNHQAESSQLVMSTVQSAATTMMIVIATTTVVVWWLTTERYMKAAEVTTRKQW